MSQAIIKNWSLIVLAVLALIIVFFLLFILAAHWGFLRYDSSRYSGTSRLGIKELKTKCVPCAFIESLVPYEKSYNYDINRTGRVFALEFFLSKDELDAYFSRIDSRTNKPLIKIVRKIVIDKHVPLNDESLSASYLFSYKTHDVKNGYLFFAEYFCQGDIIDLKCYYDSDSGSFCVQTNNYGDI